MRARADLGRYRVVFLSVQQTEFFKITNIHSTLILYYRVLFFFNFCCYFAVLQESEKYFYRSFEKPDRVPQRSFLALWDKISTENRDTPFCFLPKFWRSIVLANLQIHTCIEYWIVLLLNKLCYWKDACYFLIYFAIWRNIFSSHVQVQIIILGLDITNQMHRGFSKTAASVKMKKFFLTQRKNNSCQANYCSFSKYFNQKSFEAGF